MSQQTINLGTSPGGAQGDNAREAFQKVNDNFSELYGTQQNLGTAAELDATTAHDDATAGRLLKVGDFGLGGVGITIADANAIRNTGTYLIPTTGSGGVNGPDQIESIGWTIHHFAASAAASTPAAFQVASPQTSVTANKYRLFHRQVFGGTWSDWREFIDMESLATFGWGRLAANSNNIASGTDLNTMTVPGSYAQTTNTAATAALNYPITNAGTLLVQTAGGNIITQQYTQYNAGQSWVRSCYNGTWSKWKKVATDWDTGLGATRMGDLTFDNPMIWPIAQGNTTPSIMFGVDAGTAQTDAHQPIEGQEFAGISCTRSLRPIQMGVSGRGSAASLWFRGYSNPASTLSDWKQAVAVGDYGLGSFSVRLTDASAPTASGTYRLAGTDANVPETTSGCSLWHSQQVSNIAQQIAIVTTNNNFWSRSLNNGTWSDWAQSITTMNVAALPLTAAMAASTDNNRSLGTASRRWSTVYAGTGTIATSDAREKTEVSSLTADELKAASLLAKEIGTFKWLASISEKGDGARAHVGLTVQRAMEIMQSCGLDPAAYGFVCYDEWGDTYEDVPAEYGFRAVAPEYETVEVEDPETGEVTTMQVQTNEGEEESYLIAPASRRLVREAGNRYAFRHDQLTLFMAAGMEARLAALEQAAGLA